MADTIKERLGQEIGVYGVQTSVTGELAPHSDLVEAIHAVGELSDLCEAAWGIIANAHGGDWAKESPEWQEAAVRWRDRWHKTLPQRPESEAGRVEPPAPTG